MGSVLLSILGFLVILGPLVVVHEFGHFIFARIFNVKAEAFSIGFGPRLWKRQFGETEFRISAIPLGGYVKLLGEDPETKLTPEEQKRALNNQEAYKRFFIFFGGPLFNFLFAIFVFMIILVIGEPHIASVIGRVEKSSFAEKAGFRSGDRIVSVAGEEVRKFSDVLMAVSEKVGVPVDFQVQRAGKEEPIGLTITPPSKKGYSLYGEVKEIGTIPGIFPMPRGNIVGISSPKSKAAKMGIQTGDQLTRFNDQPILSWEDLTQRYEQLRPGSQFEIEVKRKGDPIPVSFQKPRRSKSLKSDLGLHSSELFIDSVIAQSPAAQAGLEPGDRLASINGKEVNSFFSLKDLIQESGRKTGKVNVAWERNGQLLSATLTPKESTEKDPVMNDVTTFTVGVVPKLIFAEPAKIVERVWNPLLLLYKATERMVVFTWRNLVSLGKMFTGQVSIKTLGGPILIGKIAGDSLSRGLIAFLTTMAILSVGLGILNVLPIPVLDGGHLLLLGIEVVRGKPLSLRQIEILQRVGLSLILLLMVIVMKNDIARLF